MADTLPPETNTTLVHRYRRLLELSRDLASTLDLDGLLQRIVQAAADVCAAEAASILLYDDVKQELYFQAATNLTEPSMRGLVVPMDSLAGWIVRNQKPLRINDVSRDRRHFARISEDTKFLTHSLLGVPMVAKDKVIGALEAINKKDGTFSEEDLEILGVLGAQAAIAIENSRLFQQSDLISEFIHELRTPLGSINTAAHLLKRPELSEEQRATFLQTIQSESRRLSELATSFLDLARLESGRVQFRTQRLAPYTLLQECTSVMRLPASEKQQNLTLEAPEDLPEIQADRAKLKQVLINLLSNAVKYTPAGGKITLSATADAEELRICVRDTGRGIPPDALQNLFQKFYRVPGSERMAQGTGLGLSIARKIVEGHGGRISVESEVGKGTTFTVHLPR
ncbi:MAG TPA: GAF domain-containing protein [Chloroflexi bacterium]|nr:GAF domain-containing protein [Chloroflexota bacterium]